MPKAFSVVSWNVEHFSGKQARLDRIVSTLKKHNPDIIAIYEVKGEDVFTKMTDAFPTYSFHITEGPQVQEILIGVRGNMSAFFTQKVDFKGGNPRLRPGAILTVKKRNKAYTLLFLHTKSLPDPKGFGLRDYMLEKAIKLKNVIKKKIQQEPNYIFLGDLNTMGMNYKYSKYDIPQEEELDRLKRFCKRHDLKVLSKTHDETYGSFNRRVPLTSDLDHAVASEHLKFKSISGKDVLVEGWCDEPTIEKKKKWTEEYSDHNLLFFTVME